MKKILAPAVVVLLAIALVFSLFTFFGMNNASGTPPGTTPGEVGTISVAYDRDDLDAGWSDSEVSSIALKGNAITMEGSGATVDGTIITITSAGTYSISGTLDDGQIIVDTDDKETVKLVLNGAAISCSTSAPISVINAEKTVITLAGGTENTVTDGSAYIFEDLESNDPNAAIFSKDDLTINGAGSLTVNARYNNGIQSKDELRITGGTITVTAVNDGIKGKDAVAIRDGIITIEAGGDGIQST
ncbi:MAG: carbohydrate-binding domain-containing protein, partial [Methanofollis liminatans]|nr:carbohydrate-binding domain-containing protein [Methanofollis liminatans]